MDIEKLVNAADGYSQKKQLLTEAKEHLEVFEQMQVMSANPECRSIFRLNVSGEPLAGFPLMAAFDSVSVAAQLPVDVLRKMLPLLVEAQQAVVTQYQMDMQEMADQLVLSAMATSGE